MAGVLPITVREAGPLGGGLWGVTLVMADGTERRVVVPETLATLEAVRFSVTALAVLSAQTRPLELPRSSHHRRYAPRT